LEGISWGTLVDFAYLSVFLLAATLLRSRVKFLQKFLVPNSIIAGILAIVFGQYIFNIFNLDDLGEYVYHLLTLSFIAVGLRGTTTKHSYGAITTSVTAALGIAIQGLLGLVFTLILILTYFPDLFPTFGIQLVLGFANNPGVAYGFGKSWEAMGFVEGGQVGLTFGAIGFLWAYLMGMIIVNWGVRKNKTSLGKSYKTIPKSVFTGIIGKDEPKQESGKITTASEAIDSMTLHMSLVGMVFLITYLFMNYGLGYLHRFGGTVSELATSLEGFNFVFGIVFAFLTRKIISIFRVTHVIDNRTMTRLGGLFLDFMIVTAIAAISIEATRAYWLEIALLTTLGALITLGSVFFLNYRMHLNYHFERAVTDYGALTGTITSGLALLRIIDPELETPVAIDRVYSGGIVFFLALPILLSINIPAVAYTQGNPIQGLLTAIGIVVVYIIVLPSLWRFYKYLYMRKVRD
jgi:glutamate:Na+ symporter, ESS family